MALSNFTNITSAVEDWLNRSGFTSVTDRVEDFVVLAQRRIQRNTRVPPMEVRVTLTVDSVGEATIPTDYLDTKYMVGSNSVAAWPIQRRSYFDVKHVRLRNDGDVAYFDTEAGKFLFGPVPGSSQSVELVYYRELEFISSSVQTNWFSLYAPELILWGALVEASIFLKDFEMVGVYTQKFKEAEELLKEQKQLSESSSTPLHVIKA